MVMRFYGGQLQEVHNKQWQGSAANELFFCPIKEIFITYVCVSLSQLKHRILDRIAEYPDLVLSNS